MGWDEGVDNEHKGSVGVDARDRRLERSRSTVADKDLLADDRRATWSYQVAVAGWLMNAEKSCSMQVAPGGKARAVKFQLDGSQFEDKNDYYINYVGGYEAPAPGAPAAQ